MCFKRAKIIVKKWLSSYQNLTKDLLCSRKPSGLWNYEAKEHSLYGNRNVQQDGKLS